MFPKNFKITVLFILKINFYYIEEKSLKNDKCQDKVKIKLKNLKSENIF